MTDTQDPLLPHVVTKLPDRLNYKSTLLHYPRDDRSHAHLLRGEALLEAAAANSASKGSIAFLAQSRIKKTLMIAANVILNAFSVDGFLSLYSPFNHSWSGGTYLRIFLVAVLGYGTIYSNIFSKVPMLDSPVNGLVLNDKQKRIHRAIERAMWQAELFNQPSVDVYLSADAAKAFPRPYDSDGSSESKNQNDNFALHAIAHLLEAQYMGSKGAEGAYYRPLRIFAAKETSGFDTLYELKSGHGSTVQGGVDRIAVGVDYDCSKLPDYKAKLFDSALGRWSYAKDNKAMALYYSLKWFAIRGLLGVAFIVTLNHSLFSLVSKFSHLKDDHSNALAVMTPVKIGVTLAAGLVVGFYRALSANSIQAHKTYKEFARLWARLCYRIVSWPSCLQVGAFFAAIAPILITVMFNESMSLYNGKDGVQTIVNQYFWMFQIANATYAVTPSEYNPVTYALMVPNTLTAWGTSIIETYRRMEMLVGAKPAAERAHDTSHQDHSAVWRQVQVTTVLDSINYAFVAAFSAYNAWGHILGTKEGDAVQFNKFAGQLIAWVMFAGIVCTAVPWSLSTASNRFSGAYKLFCTRGDKPQKSEMTTQYGAEGPSR